MTNETHLLFESCETLRGWIPEEDRVEALADLLWIGWVEECTVERILDLKEHYPEVEEGYGLFLDLKARDEELDSD